MGDREAAHPAIDGAGSGTQDTPDETLSATITYVKVARQQGRR
ncbi:hypothetical protein [Streptomyces sp. 1222.5]